ncbi:MAG: GNAT family N-acetyltransferase [Acetatifactor sp.]|nr:GNAT family N-acetyltransferase [Acetatifactor sp.]
MKYRIERLEQAQVADIYSQYLTKHFPADEVKPLKSINRMWDMGAYRAYAMYSEEATNQDNDAVQPTLIGYAFFATAPTCDLILLDYFAILEPCRGQGLGSLFLQELKNLLPDYKGILIETEDIDRAQNETELQTRRKRDLFYEKNGVLRTRVKGTVYGVHYAVWNFPLSGISDDVSCQKGMEQIYRIMIPGEKNTKYVKIEIAF